MHATSTSHELPFSVVPVHPLLVIVKPSETVTPITFIFFLPEGSLAVSGCDAPVVLIVTLPNESGPLSCSVGCESADVATSAPSDCANAGRASVPIRSSSAKVRAANGRTNDLQLI